jgi:hypothetical protein
MKEKRPRWRAQPSDVAVAQRGHTLHAEQQMPFTSGSQLGPACQDHRFLREKNSTLDTEVKKCWSLSGNAFFPPKSKSLGL